MIRRHHSVFRATVLALSVAAVTMLVTHSAGAQNSYKQHNLVSNVPGLADVLDASLVNPWGISSSTTSPFWISNNGTGNASLYNTFGVKQGLVVTIPTPGTPPSAPTGQVFNNAGAFALTPGNNARFLFATEDGTISGWNPAVNATNAVTMVDNSASGAIYKGLAISGSGATARLYGANFHAGTVEVWDGAFSSVFGGFIDPTLPAGYAPFNVQNLGGNIFVAYARQDDQRSDEVAGPGFGYVSMFDPAGVFLRRFASGGALNAPWGMTFAPSSFGAFGGDLLIGNFGDGRINAFDPITGLFQGALQQPDGSPIEIDGLWGLIFGNGGNGGDPNTLYFTAGIDDEANGLFGSIAVAPVTTPEPSTVVMFATGLIGLAGITNRRRRPAG
jgi:uncharacterized protein (TIGR03118 family)